MGEGTTEIDKLKFCIGPHVNSREKSTKITSRAHITRSQVLLQN